MDAAMLDARMHQVGEAAKTDLGVPHALRKDEEFWFDDGTIFLIAGDVEFRVYKGLLARRSPVFADMFLLPQPGTRTSIGATAGSDLTALPVVHLTDTPDAFRILLRAMAPDDDASMFQATDPDCFTITSCMRLGHKYQMDKIVMQCVRYLEQYFPTTFHDFAAVDDFLPPGLDHDCTYVIGLINLARLTGATHMLPVLFMLCAWWLDGDTLVEGIVWPDGSNETLSPADLARCFNARCDLTRARTDSLRRRISSLPSNTCEGAGKCRDVVHAMFLYAMANVEPYPFVRLHTVWKARGLCVPCEGQLVTLDDVEMCRVWDDLPQLVGMGPIEGWGKKIRE